ncbi:NADPH-dependent 7-cyano-7-deazaguanine reductase QueF [Candidatus Bandiella euplotis]|uniref:NADPH-dependent 7-cyano-7-deazaguanine reductase n=1 Tax=Candidatus Bandiella euplotis TaxID=1664265 RepID=A0ABZ0UK21_9RICK|nr:NADPH-dependent 7-cyano-7-deazaguanine reductase QueF [Candidatus Bandiella woodruffii]WPX96049.1 NADPH-dependent 7-cyano-7-deazaguanine reductase [Candidatus Bandiella woodruffii]
MTSYRGTFLGKKSEYTELYDNSLLFPISRTLKRNELGMSANTPVFGHDVWNAYEISWLRSDGRPEVSMAEIIYSAQSEFIIESKSLKLYLNSFNGTVFTSPQHVKDTIQKDMSDKLNTDVQVKLIPLETKVTYMTPPGVSIDDFYSNAVENKKLAAIEGTRVFKEKLFTNLLKSNCPVTMQPDWGTLMLTYSGNKINYASLLNYIISLRGLNEFHEQCIEKIYMDIYHTCKPEYLEVYARYTRRGGVDINPYRCSEKSEAPLNYRVQRQ